MSNITEKSILKHYDIFIHARENVGELNLISILNKR